MEGLATAEAAAPAVIVTGIYVKSVPLYVTVLDPGELASLPPFDLMQIAEEGPRELRPVFVQKHEIE